MAPSITPITNLNSGFRVYEVDSAVCNIKIVVNGKLYLRLSDIRNTGCPHVRLGDAYGDSKLTVYLGGPVM